VTGRKPLAEQVVGRPPQLVGNVRGFRQGLGVGDEQEVGEVDIELHDAAPQPAGGRRHLRRRDRAESGGSGQQTDGGKPEVSQCAGQSKQYPSGCSSWQQAADAQVAYVTAVGDAQVAQVQADGQAAVAYASAVGQDEMTTTSASDAANAAYASAADGDSGRLQA
jgi:hypothetical protein